MSAAFDETTSEAAFEYLLRLGDDRLVLGHRVSEWCGRGPILEEDIALSNIALDALGQANNFLGLAGQIEGKERTADDLAYFREAIEFRNLMLVEQPNGDFACTMARQFLFDAFSVPLTAELSRSSWQELAGIAGKAAKEDTYHLRHSSQWVLRLGDGTEESRGRMQEAFDALWMYTDELFEADDIDALLAKDGIAPDLASLRPQWERTVADTLSRATLRVPEAGAYMSRGSRQGRHTEHLGHLLSEMQILARSYPVAKW